MTDAQNQHLWGRQIDQMIRALHTFYLIDIAWANWDRKAGAEPVNPTVKALSL